jgi:hypothetical protein
LALLLLLLGWGGGVSTPALGRLLAADLRAIVTSLASPWAIRTTFGDNPSARV